MDLLPSLIVPPALDAGDVCPACTNPSHRGALCIVCRCYAQADDRLPVPVEALSWYGADAPLARALYRYKCATGLVRHEAMDALADLLSRWLSMHPFSGVDVSCMCPVPSTRSTGMPHPLESLVGAVPNLPWPLCRLEATGESVVRRRLNPNAFIAPPELNGESVLLLDDVYASGATAQSAAHAILAAGGNVHRIVVLARRMNPTNDLTTAIRYNRQRDLGPPDWAALSSSKLNSDKHNGPKEKPRPKRRPLPSVP